MNPYEYCRTVADKSMSPLVQSRTYLSEHKAVMFDVCYSAMRVIDDYVDETYLCDGAVNKDTAIAHVNNWEMSIRAGFDGLYNGTCPEYENVMVAINDRMADADMPVTPFRQLAQAMRWDIAQSPLKNTMDFTDYCVGATNAPTYIYLYILTADVGAGYADNAHLDKLNNWSRLFGEYCYLIHIARDLETDIAKQSPQQITIPHAWLSDWGVTIDDLMAGQGLDTARQGILDTAEMSKGDVMQAGMEILDILGNEESKAFSHVINCYYTAHKKMATKS